MVLEWHSRSGWNNKVSSIMLQSALEVLWSQNSTNGFGATTASEQHSLYMEYGWHACS
jgi:hypothetical protein